MDKNLKIFLTKQKYENFRLKYYTQYKTQNC